MKLLTILIALAASAVAQCTADSRGIVITGLTAAQDSILGPLICDGASPWVYGDLVEKQVGTVLATNALAETPVLGSALSGTFSWNQGDGQFATTADLRTPLTGQAYIVIAWNSIDGTGTGRNICQVGTVTATTVTCANENSIRIPSGSGVNGYLLSSTVGPSSFNFTGWVPQNGFNVSTTWNYYDTAIALYRLYYKTGTASYLTNARAFADIGWQWTLDHGYGGVYIAPRAQALIGQFFRALDGHTERLPGLYITVQADMVPNIGGSVPNCPYCDLREAGYGLWAAVLGAKADTDMVTRHPAYCSYLTTYVPSWNTTQQSDGSWGQREYAINAGYVDAPKNYTAPFIFQGAPWRQAIDVRMMEGAYESLKDTTSQGCNSPSLAATTLTTITNAVTWQRNYGRNSVGRGTAYEVDSASQDQNTIVNPPGTVAISRTDNHLVGTGTTFLTSGMPATNPFIGIQGPNDPRTVYQIASCSDNFHCLLTVNFGIFGEGSDVTASQYSIAPPAFTNCNSSASFCGNDQNDRNLVRTQCGGMGWLYAQTHNATYQGWASECISATLGGPTAGPTNADNIGSASLPCSGPACDGIITDIAAALPSCASTGGVPPCQNYSVISNLGKNFSEAFGAPAIDNAIADLQWFQNPGGSVLSGKHVFGGKAVLH